MFVIILVWKYMIKSILDFKNIDFYKLYESCCFLKQFITLLLNSLYICYVFQLYLIIFLSLLLYFYIFPRQQEISFYTVFLFNPEKCIPVVKFA